MKPDNIYRTLVDIKWQVDFARDQPVFSDGEATLDALDFAFHASELEDQLAEKDAELSRHKANALFWKEKFSMLDGENARLREDRKRLEWLVNTGIYLSDVTPMLLEKDWRTAIDEARGKHGKGVGRD